METIAGGMFELKIRMINAYQTISIHLLPMARIDRLLK